MAKYNTIKQQEQEELENLNKQINYTIIRMLWKYYRKDVNELYSTFGISRDRYSKLLANKGLQPRIESDAKRLSKLTRVDTKIFLGTDTFEIDIKSLNISLEIKGTNNYRIIDSWEEYFEEYDDCLQDKNGKQRAYNLSKMLSTAIIKLKPDQIKQPNLFWLIHFLNLENPKKITEKLEHISDELNEIYNLEMSALITGDKEALNSLLNKISVCKDKIETAVKFKKYSKQKN